MFYSPYTDPLVRQQNRVSLVLTSVFGAYFSNYLLQLTSYELV
ncbi:hypothetical protein QE382_001780 [Sphingobacterium zeae]|uniref:MFS transporter n=1 Tax=Sphingobacterium zeae TaxID=1776859 RepID=A0ABU0U4A5_9SPHI|nr:hypothetical protein [Sphingobacterium zeae]